jgi:hypothetical protein
MRVRNLEARSLFLKAWGELYKGTLAYRANSELIEFDAARNVARLQVEDVRADLFNVIPPQQSGRVAQPLGGGGVPDLRKPEGPGRALDRRRHRARRRACPGAASRPTTTPGWRPTP